MENVRILKESWRISHALLMGVNKQADQDHFNFSLVGLNFRETSF